MYGWWRYMVRSHWAGREARLQREQRLQTVNATWATAWRVGRAGATWTGSSDLVGSAQSRFSQERPGCHTASKCHRCDATSRRENLNRNHRGLLVLLGSAMACTHASDRNKFKSRREGDRNLFQRRHGVSDKRPRRRSRRACAIATSAQLGISHFDIPRIYDDVMNIRSSRHPNLGISC